MSSNSSPDAIVASPLAPPPPPTRTDAEWEQCVLQSISRWSELFPDGVQMQSVVGDLGQTPLIQREELEQIRQVVLAAERLRDSGKVVNVTVLGEPALKLASAAASSGSKRPNPTEVEVASKAARVESDDEDGYREESAKDIEEFNAFERPLLEKAMREYEAKKQQEKKVFPACPECKGTVTSSTALDGCYDCHKEDSEHVYMCSAACLKRSLCRTGSCEHWSLYDCQEALGITPKASPGEIAADRAEKYKRRDDYEASEAQRKNANQ